MLEHETDVFRAACERLSITATASPRIFGVSRQTFSSWVHGKAKVPHHAFIKILEMENKDYFLTAERMEQIQETVSQMKAAANAEKGKDL